MAPGLRAKAAGLELAHHLTTAKPTQVAAAVFVRRIERELRRECVPQLALRQAIAQRGCFALGSNQDVARVDLVFFARKVSGERGLQLAAVED